MVATGALRVRHALAIILGANVGTTMTAQLVAFGLHELGLPLLAVGLVVQLVPHRRRDLPGARSWVWAALLRVVGAGEIPRASK